MQVMHFSSMLAYFIPQKNTLENNKKFVKFFIQKVNKSFMFLLNSFFYIESIFLSYKYIEGTLKWVSTLDIYGKYSQADRQPFPCPQQIKNTCGFVKTYKNFSMFWIMNAGHMVSYNIITLLIPNTHMINLCDY